MTLLKNGMMNSEHQVSRGRFFLIFLIIIFQTLSLSIWKGNCGSRALNSLIYFVFGLPKVSLIMLQYENTDFAFFQNKNSVVYVNYIQLKQDIMFFITAKDLTRAGIWRKKCSFNLYSFWNIIWMLSLSEKVLHELAIVLWL